MEFHRTNSVDDPGFEKSPAEVAAEFWASDIGKAWASGEREGWLARFTISVFQARPKAAT